MLLDYFWWRPAAPSGSHYGYHPWIHGSGRKKLKGIPPEVIETATEVITEIIKKPRTVNPQVDEYRAAQEFKRRLEEQHKEWLQAYMQVLSILYLELEQEREDAQIAMLLFDM